MSSTINTTITSVFLNDLTKDRSRIKEVTPAVIFKRVLGVGENLDRAGIIKALQRQASNNHVLQEYHNNLTNPRLVGEVISFDIGPHPSWMKFTVVKEPLPKPKKGNTLNFIVTVTDKPAGKRWTRLIGAIANEANEDGDMVPVFRTISDMCEEEDIMKPTDESKLRDLKKEEGQQPAEVQQEEATTSAEEDLKQPEPPNDDTIIISNGQVVEFIKTDKDHFKIFDATGTALFEEIESTLIEDLKGDTGESFKYVATNDVRLLLLKTCSPKDIVAEFKKYEPPKGPEEVSGEGEEASDEQEPKGEEIPKENAEETPSAPQKSGSEGETTPPSQIADIDETGTEREKLFSAGEDGVEFEEAPGCLFKATKDIYSDEWEKMTQEERMALFEKYYEPKKEEQPKEEKEVEYWAKKDEVREIDGKKFTVKQDVTTDMLRENNGDVTPWVEEIKGESIADIDKPTESAGEPSNAEVPAEQRDWGDEKDKEKDIKPIGDIPPKAMSIKDDGSRPEDHLNTLFGTTTPNIMHLLNFLKSECTNEAYKGEEWQLTGTFPVELLSVWPKYTYSILRMKNGAYYRIFVCMTDLTRTDSQSWIKTHDEPGRWMRVCDIQDRDVSGIFNRRRV